MKKVLVTGANGLLGQKLVNLYLSSPYKDQYALIASSRGKNRNAIKEGYQYETIDLTQEAEVTSVVNKITPDIIIHTAAMTQVDACETEKKQCWLNNVEAVRFLIKASESLAQSPFFLHLSTDFIFDGAAGPYIEDAEPNPVSYYGESKLEAERIVEKSRLKWAIARTVLVYGITPAMSRSNIILWVKKSLEDGKTIHVVDDQWRTPTLAEDLAMGCYLIANQEAQGVFNISGKELLTPYDMAIQTADFFKLDKSLIVRTDASRFSQTAKRPPKTGFVLDKAESVLGYQPHSFTEGIRTLSEQLSTLTQ